MAEEAEPALSSLLAGGSIHLTATATDREDAVRQTGRALLDAGAVDAGYIDAMLERERSVSTYVGEGIAIPHGTRAATDRVLRDAIVVLRFPEGVDWQGNDVRVCVGIAALGGGHIALLSRLARVLLEPEAASSLRAAATESQVYAILE
ncbi:MAG: mannitol system component [Microbacteriaceae bacterium]|nr:mannitol system component [Microbacteriaceae bacterium]